jgi:hypothetical protein
MAHAAQVGQAWCGCWQSALNIVAEVLGAKTIRIDAGGLYSPATQERVAVEAGAGGVSEDRARLLEF